MEKVTCPHCQQEVEFYAGDLFLGGETTTLVCEHCDKEMRITRYVEYTYDVRKA